MDAEGEHTGPLLERLRRIEERLARVEAELNISAPVAPTEPPPTPAPAAVQDEEDLEFRLGGNWFARVGIVVIAIGVAFLLTFPYQGLPPVAPALMGYVIAAGVFLLSRLWRDSYALVSSYLRAAGLALLYFTTLRLSFFGTEAVVRADSPPGALLLVVVVTLSVVVALRRQSAYLAALALVLGYTTVTVVDSTAFTFAGLTILSALAAYLRLRYGWTLVMAVALGLTYLTHLMWAAGNPLLSHPLAMVTSPVINLGFLLLYAVIFGIATLFRRDNAEEQLADVSTSVLNGAGSYAVFLIVSLSGFSGASALLHVLASVTLLALAFAFWIRERSRYSTFVYAMLGYVALSVAILKAFTVPDVFVWLSVQSMLVVATAVWFRSRFIVVANFIIYVSVVLGYVVVSTGETGVSLGFGVVALVSARILNWQQRRLELRTEMMRNAYLASAWAVFPYALYHLVPRGYVILSWVGIAVFYYLMHLVIQNQKYRWMGHLTLLLTVAYVLVIGIIQLDPTYRIVSFLVLGIALVTVSLVFTRLRAKRRAARKDQPQT